MPTFTHGNKARLLAAGQDISSYLNSVTIAATADTAETSALTDVAKNYIPGELDATLQVEGMFAGTINQIDQILYNALGVDYTVLTYLPAGDANGAIGAGLSSDPTSYQVTSAITDANKVTAAVQSIVGAEAVTSFQAALQVTASGTSTVINNTVGTPGQPVGYLHAISNGGTVVFKIQDSADNITYADVITFANVVAGTVGLRTSAAGTVRQYTRMTYTVTAGTVTFWGGVGRASHR